MTPKPRSSASWCCGWHRCCGVCAAPLRSRPICFGSRPRYCAIGGSKRGRKTSRRRPFGLSKPRSRFAMSPRMVGTTVSSGGPTIKSRSCLSHQPVARHHTTRSSTLLPIYDSLYCARGQAENLIKLHKTQLASDRTSCRSALANQVRLVLHTAAYWLMLTVRDAIPKTRELATAEFATLRLRLLKIAARVVETASLPNDGKVISDQRS
jgi:Transposase DDE domain group 1